MARFRAVQRILPFLLGAACLACATTTPTTSPPKETPMTNDALRQSADALVADQVVALAYSGFRPGQHPDRGDGAKDPSDAEILEDLQILDQGGFHLIRLYDSGESSRRTLALIQEHKLPIKVMVGAWLQAEVSNHEGCEWLTEPIPEAELAANTKLNEAEIARAIALAKAFPDIVVTINVGNEMLVSWNDHMVSLEKTLQYIAQVKAAVPQPVTVADNYVVWIEYPELGKAVDFASVHTYAVWEGRDIDDGLGFTIDNLARVRAANPDLKIAIGEAGWASIATEFGPRASQDKQKRYYDELTGWAKDHNVTVFFFEAFDEDWKGNPHDPNGAEKHWGVFNGERQPKKVMQALYPDRTPAPASD